MFLNVLLSAHIFHTQNIKKKFKEDFVELSNIKYGLFNVDQWKKTIVNIFSKKINEFEIQQEDKQKLKKNISKFLYKTIQELEHRFYAQNEGNIRGEIKNGVVYYTGIFRKMKQDVPVFSNQIIEFAQSKKSKKGIKEYLKKQLNKYSNQTFSKIDYFKLNKLVAKYHFRSVFETKMFLQKKINALNQESKFQQHALIILLFLMFTTLFILKYKYDKYIILILTLNSIVFLILGLMLPMIEIDARISEFRFILLKEEVLFTNQIIYYKSKSILDVVEIMLFNGGADLLIVGITILSFSIIFPVLKILCGLFVIFYPKKLNKILKFLIFKTGKWSMADVMIVSIFMTYLGFSGIIKEQLTGIQKSNTDIEILTTNNSNLEIGFISFFAFTALSMLISYLLSKCFTENPK
jgi:hypothetical protein